MKEPQPTAEARRAAATRENVVRITGDVDEHKVLDILALNPTVEEVEEAALWATGDGDILGRTGRPLAGIVADIYEILTADEEEPPPTG